MNERRKRRVHRTRAVAWSYTLMAVATSVLAWLQRYDVASIAPVTVVVLGIAWWPRLVVDSDGVGAYSAGRRRVVVSWAEIDGVRVGMGRSFQDAIILTVAGRDLVLAGPRAATWWFGASRYGQADLQRAYDDVAAGWRVATGRTSEDVGSPG